MPKKKLKGKVVSDKMTKTVVVETLRLKRHPIYEKLVGKNRKIKAHNELGAKEGDTVVIEECTPISKEKRFKVVEIIETE